MFSRKFFRFFFLVKLLLIIAYCTTTRAPFSKKKPDPQVTGWERHVRRDSVHHLLSSQPLMLPREFCSRELALVVVVHSPPSHQENRRMIRRTWGMFAGDQAALFFLLGGVPDAALQEDVELENHIHGDLIQEMFPDGPAARTLKSTVMLKLATRYCLHARYLLKVDDDTFVHLGNLLQALSTMQARNLLVGRLVCDQKPERRPKRKRFTPRYLFAEKTFPRYLSGGAYLMSMDVASKLFEAALVTDMLHLEDVYVTGLCARKAKVRPKHSPLFVKRKDGCAVQQAWTIGGIKGTDVDDVFYMVLDGDNGKEECTKTRSLFYVRWLFNGVLKVKDNPFSYRRFCN